MTMTEVDVGSEVRSWLAGHWDPEMALGEWWTLLARSGWGFPHYPEEWFGRGLPASAGSVVARELRAVGAFGPPLGIATMMVGPMLLELGTEEQKRAWLPGIVDGTDVWCQLFSEPGAGSDLAGLATRAVRDGDQWIVNGQKVWTSGGHYARRAILVARTDPAVPKHRGLTFFVIEMDQPGVEPRPLVQMTGDAEFNEVFLTDAVVPIENVIGDVNQGWGVALRLLSYERDSLEPEAAAGIQHPLDLDLPVGRYASGEVDDGTRARCPPPARRGACSSTSCGRPVATAIRCCARRRRGCTRGRRSGGSRRCAPLPPPAPDTSPAPRSPSASSPRSASCAPTATSSCERSARAAS